MGRLGFGFMIRPLHSLKVCNVRCWRVDAVDLGFWGGVEVVEVLDVVGVEVSCEEIERCELC